MRLRRYQRKSDGLVLHAGTIYSWHGEGHPVVVDTADGGQRQVSVGPDFAIGTKPSTGDVLLMQDMGRIYWLSKEEFERRHRPYTGA